MKSYLKILLAASLLVGSFAATAADEKKADESLFSKEKIEKRQGKIGEGTAIVGVVGGEVAGTVPASVANVFKGGSKSAPAAFYANLEGGDRKLKELNLDE